MGDKVAAQIRVTKWRRIELTRKSQAQGREVVPHWDSQFVRRKRRVGCKAEIIR